MKQLSQFFYEGGQGNIVDENGNDPMEVEDEMTVQVKSLTSVSEYLKYQWNKQHEVPAEVDDEKQQDIKENVKTKEIKEKGYTVYSDTDKYNFFLLMVTEVPRFVAPVARRYSIHPKTAQRWWKEYQQVPEKLNLKDVVVLLKSLVMNIKSI
jgi:hypothetical protein